MIWKTSILEETDCYLLNTCHIRDKAKEKVYHEIGREKKISDLKKTFVIVAGCGSSWKQRNVKQRTIHRFSDWTTIHHNNNDKIEEFLDKQKRTEKINFDAEQI